MVAPGITTAPPSRIHRQDARERKTPPLRDTGLAGADHLVDLKERRKGAYSTALMRYTILRICCIIHTFSSTVLRLYFRCLKNVGVKPVIFLNWFERCATLL